MSFNRAFAIRKWAISEVVSVGRVALRENSSRWRVLLGNRLGPMLWRCGVEARSDEPCGGSEHRE